jgi:5-methylcytosine-specific restriction enzyme A
LPATYAMPARQAIERTRGRKWMQIRGHVLRSEPRCEPCLARGRITAATEVDHIVPLKLGGTDAPNNLQSICTDCHSEKTATENGGKRKPKIGRDGWPVSKDDDGL